jgi:hypothetical protein
MGGAAKLGFKAHPHMLKEKSRSETGSNEIKPKWEGSDEAGVREGFGRD